VVINDPFVCIACTVKLSHSTTIPSNGKVVILSYTLSQSDCAHLYTDPMVFSRKFQLLLEIRI
jgi:hypothetical protein